MKPHGIYLSNKPSNTLRSKLCKLKDKRDVKDQSNIVYSIDCKNCDAKYIGQTSRQLHQRIIEHKNAVRRSDRLSQIFQHSNHYNHEMDFDNVSKLAQERNDQSRRILESMYTMKYEEKAINRSEQLSEIYIPTVNVLM